MFKLATVVALTCLSAMACLAQNPEPTVGFKKGDYALSGSVNFFSSNTENSFFDEELEDSDTKNYQYSFNPAAHHFITDHIVLGVEGMLGESSQEWNERRESTNDFWQIGTFGSYYFTPQKKFSFLATLGVNYGGNEYSSTFLDEDGMVLYNNRGDSESISASMSAGLNYFISSHFALRARLGGLSYSTTTSDNYYTNQDNETTKSEEKSNRFNFNTGLDHISVGLLYSI
jgi:opacity protein-like surface antigen